VAAMLAATTLVVPSVAAQEAATYVVAHTGGAGLVIRAGPATDQPVLGALPEGTTVEVIDSSLDGWLLVQPARTFDLPAGFCNATYLMPQVFMAQVTGYANGSDGGAVGTVTASGTRTHWGTVAADWRQLPLGTHVQIDGFDDTVFVVEDTGSGVRGQLVDVWFPDVGSAQAFGTQRRRVTVVSP
jgi:3D (Asp-Asp-Asp) domain-containing protein